MMVRLFRVSMPSSVLALVISDTVLLFSCYILAAYWTLEAAPEIYLLEDGGLYRIAFVVALIQAGLYFSDLYDDYRARSRVLLVQQFCLVIGAAFLLQALMSYARWLLLLPRWMMVYGSAGVLVVLPLWRVAYAAVIGKAVGAQKLLFLGTSPAVREIIGHLVERPELGLSAAGFLELEPNGFTELHGVSCLGGVERLQEVVRTQKPDCIVVGAGESRNRLPMDTLLELRFSGIEIQEAATVYEEVLGRVSTRDLRPSQLIFSEQMGPKAGNVGLQTAYSLALGAFGTLVFLPVMAVAAAAVKLTSRGPILYRQTRVGLRSRHFTLYKFRSMYVDAEERTGAVWAAREDPRVTPVGRWLRRLRLDELPQFFNVLRGEMAIVGPRPERPEFTTVFEEKIAFYRQRQAVKPGITGWAQINHGYGDRLEDVVTKLEYDLYYIKHLAPALDAFIIFHTLKVMLLSRGAQ
jgi:exopolysaccharide biosynthesis polyprenyl glycosylphosphotransferase